MFEKVINDKDEFISRHALVISPLSKTAVGETITFKFKNSLFIQDAIGKEIISIEANFDTSTDYIIYENGTFTNPTISINYSESGEKVLTFVVTLEDGTLISTQGLVTVGFITAPSSNPDVVNDSIHAVIPFEGYDDNDFPRRGFLQYRTYYGNSQNILLKPIIIIDGFDPGDVRKYEDGDQNPAIPDNDHRSIRELMQYNPDNPDESGDIINLLNGKGYDVILVNHPTYTSVSGGLRIDGGADYIEHNAYTHVALYDRINQELEDNESDEELVIIGPVWVVKFLATH